MTSSRELKRTQSYTIIVLFSKDVWARKQTLEFISITSKESTKLISSRLATFARNEVEDRAKDRAKDEVKDRIKDEVKVAVACCLVETVFYFKRYEISS